MHPQRMTKADRKMVNDLDYVNIKFPVSKKDYSKIELKNSICISVFCYEIWFLLFIYWIKGLKTIWIYC